MNMVNNSASYQKIVSALKRKKKGATAADICAATALPLEEVRRLLPKAADEYSGHLQVTQSGEILYYFPDGFTSRYKGTSVKIKKAFNLFASAVKTVSVFLFKFWIMVMLVGYFALFMALVLASVVLTVAAQSNSKGSSKGSFRLSSNLFSLLWRIWFFSEVSKPRYGNYKVSQKKKNTRPMHKAVFSFVFGDGNSNADWDEKEDKAVITYIQSNRGVISLVEYMALTGKNSAEAEQAILSFCARFAGSPEVTEEGIIVYRFEEILLRADSGNYAELSPPIKQLKAFSNNPQSMNTGFVFINSINLLFGSYFLYHSLASNFFEAGIEYQASFSYFYKFTNVLLENFVNNAPYFIFTALGVIPFIFSLLFWIIPSVRKFMEKKENEGIKLGNFKKFCFSKIWVSPKNIDMRYYMPISKECLPKNTISARDRVIKDLGVVSIPEVEIDERGNTIYSFNGLENERSVVKKYRDNIDTGRLKLGSAVFDSGE